MYVTWQSYSWGPKLVEKTHFWWIRIEKYSSISIGVMHHAWQFKTSNNTNHAKPIHNTKRFGIWMPWLLGIGSYDKHQCGQSTFSAWRWGLHVGRKRGCLNRINQWGGVASLRRVSTLEGHPKTRGPIFHAPTNLGGTNKCPKASKTIIIIMKLHSKKKNLLMSIWCTFKNRCFYLFFVIFLTVFSSFYLGKSVEFPAWMSQEVGRWLVNGW